MELHRPKAIEAGMTLGVVSPTSAIEAEDIEKGLEQAQADYLLEIFREAQRGGDFGTAFFREASAHRLCA